MMKKIVALLLVLCMVFALAACSEEVPVTEEQVEEVIEAVEEVLPSVEELAAEAKELYYSGELDGLIEALEGLEDSGEDLVNELIGLCKYHGYGTEMDPEAAVEILESLAENGSAAAQLVIADATNTGNGTIQNPEKAQELFKELIKMAESASEALPGCVYTAVADCYARGIGVDVDVDKAMEAVEKAMASELLATFDKIALADLLTGDMLRANYPAQAELLYKDAFDGVKALAEQGNVKAIKLMGDYYLEGIGGIEQDYEKAMEYFLQAADYNYAPAQAQIGLMYRDGLGVEVDYEQAMEWNNRAAQQGNAQGQAQIGYLYHMGLGVTQNLDEAGRWYLRAADQGDVWAKAKFGETEITNPHLAFEFHA